MISARDRDRDRVDAVRSRDAFLEVVAQKLDERVTGACALGSKLRGNRNTRKLQAALEDLAGFVRELRMIAMPHEAMTMRRRKLDLAALVTATFEEQRKRLAAGQVTVEVRRSGSVSGRWDGGHLMTILLELMSNAVTQILEVVMKLDDTTGILPGERHGVRGGAMIHAAPLSYFPRSSGPRS